ncbi:hypothetical protein HLI_15140 [Halobacillus litoralis]|uniref:Uncharacterized protein n=1 Tax=Halobacillus litoralis TaxID=45668 RepID=A0A410MFG1_9BACI|nr:hypothetical protein HLI_15140 [Halobacillus litoralis]
MKDRGIARFPWACAEPLQASPSGVSSNPRIPQESRNFLVLLAFVKRTETSDSLLQVKKFLGARASLECMYLYKA